MIAIQGHSTRGKEVIQILESLGGKNREELTGRRISHYYFINCNGDIDLNLRINLLNRKLYTLEEFEKEFPFKVGDRVISTITNFIGTITKLKESGWYYVKYDSGNLVCVFRQHLKLYKEMKEERNITLTLDKAKEWYKKGGELKEIALQAFTEKELNPLPRSWDELCRKYEFACLSTRYSNFPLKYDALFKLEQLRDCWRQGWEPIWDCSEKWCIRLWGNELGVGVVTHIARFLTFPTKEMAEEFLKCFRDLIEKAKDLI